MNQPRRTDSHTGTDQRTGTDPHTDTARDTDPGHLTDTDQHTDTDQRPLTGHPINRRTSPATDIALIAAFAALIAACALLPAISVGGAVPITLQTFGVLLAGATLGAKRGLLAVLLYLAVGAIGLPVFTGGAAGIAPFVGPSAGYLVGMPLAAFLTGFIVERLPRRKVATSIPLIFLAGFGSSIVFIHTLGALGMALFADMTIPQAFAFDLVFYPGDIVKNILMAIVATAVHRAFPALLPQRQRVEHGSRG